MEVPTDKIDDAAITAGKKPQPKQQQQQQSHLQQPKTQVPKVPTYISTSVTAASRNDRRDVINNYYNRDRGDNNDDDDDDDDGYFSDCSSLGSQSVTTSARQRQRRDIFKSMTAVAADAGAGAIATNNRGNADSGVERQAVAHHHIYDSLEVEEGEQKHDDEVEGGPGRGSLIVNGMGRLRVSLPQRKQLQRKVQEQQPQKEEQEEQKQCYDKQQNHDIGGRNSYFDGSEFFPSISPQNEPAVALPSLSRPYDGDDDDDDMEIRRSFDPFGVDDNDGHGCYARNTSNVTNKSDAGNDSIAILGYDVSEFDSERRERHSLAFNNHHHNEEVREQSDGTGDDNGSENDSNIAVSSSIGSRDERSKYRTPRPVKFLSQVVARTMGGAKRRNQSRRKQQELKPPIETTLLCYNSLSIGDKSYPLRRRNTTDRFGISQTRQGDDRSSRSSRSTMSPTSPNSAAMGNAITESHDEMGEQGVASHKEGRGTGAGYADLINHNSSSDSSSPVLHSGKETTGQYSPTSVGKERDDQMFVNGLSSNTNGVDNPDKDRWLYSRALTLSSWDDCEGVHTFRCDSPSFIFYPSTFKQDVRKR